MTAVAPSPLVSALALVAALTLWGCDPGGDRPAAASPRAWTLDGPTMGTTWSVQVPRPPAELDRAALAADVEAVLTAVNQQMSTYEADSLLSRFNASSGTDWFPVSNELAAVVAHALAVSEASGGAFDVTVGPLVNLWGFGPDGRLEQVPDQAAIDAARAHVGHAQLAARQHPPALKKADARLFVDLSAIAKGHATDRVAALLDARGVGDYLVEIGGELRARGANAGGQPWRLAIEEPLTGTRAIHRVLGLSDAALATSGDYRNFFERGGVRYSHTIAPRTGRPVTHGLASVSVVAPNTTHADAMATALLVLGPEKGFELAEREGLAAYFIERDGEKFAVRHTSAFARHVLEEGP